MEGLITDGHITRQTVKAGDLIRPKHDLGQIWLIVFVNVAGITVVNLLAEETPPAPCSPVQIILARSFPAWVRDADITNSQVKEGSVEQVEVITENDS